MGTKTRVLGIAAAVAASAALFAAPAQARTAINFSLGVPVYTQPSYVYSQPAYVYSQPGYVYAQPGYAYPQPYVYPQPSVNFVWSNGYRGYHRGWEHRAWEHRRFEHRGWDHRR
jgi:hypothetical protein